MKVKSILLTVIIFISFLYSCTIPEEEKKIINDVNKEELLRLVNEVRSKGCFCDDEYYPPAKELKWNELIEEVSLQHSIDMHQHNNLSHTGSDSLSSGDRLNNIGYLWAIYGENIAKGYSSEEKVVAGWLKSPEHCKNIMNKYYTEMAGAKNGLFWTLILADHI